MDRVSKILVSCASRNAPYLIRELESLGYTEHESEKFNVRLQGNLYDCMKLNMYLRTAHRVLYLIRGFKAHKPELLYHEIKKVPWEKYLFPDGYIHISSTVKNDFIRDTRFASLKVKDAIVDRMVEKTGRRPDSGKDRSGACLYLFWHNDNCAIYMDTSGETLAKHGYRKMPYKAPLLEALASSILLATKWNKDLTLINPMCGSGTLAIEAALMARQISPGFFRKNYSFMHFKTHSPGQWEKIRKEAEKLIAKSAKTRIIASDINPIAIKAARSNAVSAGVEDMIEWETCDFRDCTVPSDRGVVIFNPEYGERLGETEQLEEVYGQIGDFLKNKCQGYYGYIFTGNLELAKKVGLKASRRIEFFNAKIDCRLLEYELYQGTKRSI